MWQRDGMHVHDAEECVCRRRTLVRVCLDTQHFELSDCILPSLPYREMILSAFAFHQRQDSLMVLNSLQVSLVAVMLLFS